MDAIGFARHDHRSCIADCVETIEVYCQQAGLNFTPQRRRVLEILLAEHRAMGAYDILQVLQSEGLAAQPPVAYRALDFLVSNGFAHKVERLNAFIACAHPGEDHAPAFLICKTCKAVAEAPTTSMQNQLSETADTVGFLIEATIVEAIGICPNCQDSAA